MTPTPLDLLALAVLLALTLTGCTPRGIDPRPVRECVVREFEDMRRVELEELSGYEGWTGEGR